MAPTPHSSLAEGREDGFLPGLEGAVWGQGAPRARAVSWEAEVRHSGGARLSAAASGPSPALLCPCPLELSGFEGCLQAVSDDVVAL